MDVVYPDVSSGAVHEETLHHNLAREEDEAFKVEKQEEEEEDGDRRKATGSRGTSKMGTAGRG